MQTNLSSFFSDDSILTENKFTTKEPRIYISAASKGLPYDFYASIGINNRQTLTRNARVNNLTIKPGERQLKSLKSYRFYISDQYV